MRRLSGQDAFFLYQETPTALMHTLKILVCEAREPLQDTPALRELVRRSLGSLEAFHHRVVEIPFGVHHPVMIRDMDFDFDYHLNFVTLPAPGDLRALENLLSEIATGMLDRDKPLWRIWLVNGLGDNQIAYVAKIHHLLADGMASVNLLMQSMSPSPEQNYPVASHDLSSEVVPGRRRLVVDSLGALLSDMQHLPRLLLRNFRTRQLVRQRELAGGVVPPAGYSAEIPRLPFNRALSPRRLYRMAQFSLRDFKLARAHFGCTINDIALYIVATALRQYLERRGALPLRPLVCAVPVSADMEQEVTRRIGNKVAYFLVRLHTTIPDPAARLHAIVAETAAAKEVLELQGRDLSHDLMQYIPPRLFTWKSRRDFRQAAADRADFPLGANVVVSNVPGPRSRLFSPRGDPVNAIYSAGPLTEGVPLNVTFWSYIDQMNLGTITCARAIPDLDDLVSAMVAAFDALLAMARGAAARVD